MQAKPRANCRDFPPASPPISTARECRSAGMPLRHAAHKDAMQTGQAPSQLRQPEKSPLPGRERNKCRDGEGEGAPERQSELRNTCAGEAKQRSWPISALVWSHAPISGPPLLHCPCSVALSDSRLFVLYFFFSC